MSELQEIRVTARWDDEAGVWVAESDDVPGLVTEADTVEALSAKLEGLIPELLRLNSDNAPKGAIPVSLKVERMIHYAW